VKATARASAEKFPGGGHRKKYRKIAKKTKINTIKPLSGGGEGEQRKKDRKIALLNLYLQNLYHV